LLEQLVVADALASFLRLEPGERSLDLVRSGGGLEKVAGFIVRSEQRINPGAQGEVVAALAIEKGGAPLRLRDFKSSRKERFGP
jgi:hypothetical protein